MHILRCVADPPVHGLSVLCRIVQQGGSVECNAFVLLLQKLCLRDARCSRSGCLAGSALDKLLEGAREVLITAEQVLSSTVKRNRFELRWSRAIWDRFVGLAACNVAASLWLDLVIGR